MITVLKSKIHQVKVTEADKEYKGSITIDADLMEYANILPYEKVEINNKTTGIHWETYAIPGKRNTGCICLNGAAANHFKPGDLVHILCFHVITKNEYYDNYQPIIIHTDEENKFIRFGVL